MDIEIFTFGLLVISTLTGLVTEAIKKVCDERGKRPRPNTTAGIVSLFLSALIGSGYMFYTGAAWTVQTIIGIIALVFMSWLCAMLGYDKVIQTLAQIGKPKKEGR